VQLIQKCANDGDSKSAQWYLERTDWKHFGRKEYQKKDINKKVEIENKTILELLKEQLQTKDEI
jgi:hypothetical protein